MAKQKKKHPNETNEKVTENSDLVKRPKRSTKNVKSIVEEDSDSSIEDNHLGNKKRRISKVSHNRNSSNIKIDSEDDDENVMKEEKSSARKTTSNRKCTITESDSVASRKRKLGNNKSSVVRKTPKEVKVVYEKLNIKTEIKKIDSDDDDEVIIKKEKGLARKTTSKRKRNSTELDSVAPRKRKLANNKSAVVHKTPREGKVALENPNFKTEKSVKMEQSSPSSTDSGIASVLSKTENILDTPSCSNPMNSSGGGDSSSESEWEEVAEEQDIDNYKPEIPKEGVEITIDCPDLNFKRRKKKEFDENEWIRLHINRQRKEIQMNIYRTHLLCLIGHGVYLNNILNSPELKALALSLISPDLAESVVGKRIDKFGCESIVKTVQWFRSNFEYETVQSAFIQSSKNLPEYFEKRTSLSASDYNAMFVVIARALGLKTRLCICFYPVTHKAQNLISKPGGKKTEKPSLKDPSSVKKTKSAKRRTKKLSKKPPSEKKPTEIAKTDCEDSSPIKRPKRSASKSYKLSSDDDDNSESKDKDFVAQSSDEEEEPILTKNRANKSKDNVSVTELTDEDDDFEKPPVKKTVKKTTKLANRKILSDDSGPDSPENIPTSDPSNIICWAEIFSKPDKQWISIDCVNNIVNKPYDIESSISSPVAYIVAFDNNSYIKDVTRRYCSEYMTQALKLRADPDWWEETLEPFLPPNSKQDKEEEKKLDDVLINKPLPTTVAGFKNHPLYALERHLLKFEAIYPPDAATVGFFRKEPVYPRDCVHNLHSRETWLKEARVVKPGETAYKVVKARPKWDRMAGVLRTDLPLDIFGFWQTKQYEPPVAKDGKVPRNEYGNVELFKSCMLPKGTVHLQIPGVIRIAKKLGIDCSPAVVGFDGHKGSVHPVYDGFVICEEFKETILAAWEEEQENIRKREEEKQEKRVYGNWRKLIRGLLIRERINLKYNKK